MSHPLVDLARAAIHHYLKTGDYLDVAQMPGDRPPPGLFVSLHDRPGPDDVEGRLRGCRGSIQPFGDSLYAEIVRQAVNSAVDDPRCESIRPEEVDDLDITLYLLGPHQEVNDLKDLDPTRYGVIVEGSGQRRALLLPGIPGIDTAEEQVYLARRKAFIGRDESISIYRFQAEIFT
jgi:AMMECR1 domain-containing protein